MTTIVVAAAVIERDGCFLITKRQKGVHLEGYWEFPGGKVDAGETHADCLLRELREELDLIARIGDVVFSTTHAYADRTVELHFFRCEMVSEARPQLGQEMMWVARADLPGLSFPAADAELIRLLADG